MNYLLVRVKNLLETRKKLMQKYASYPLIIENQPMVKNKDQQLIEQLVKFIENHISDLSVELLSTEMAMSKSAFQRKMKALTDISLMNLCV